MGRLIPAGTGLAYHLERRRQEAEAAEFELHNDFSEVDQAFSQSVELRPVLSLNELKKAPLGAFFMFENSK